MSAHSLLHDLANAAASSIKDPGDAGTIKLEGRSLGVCEIVTTGSQTRTLPAPVRSGQWVSLQAKTMAGAATITITGGINPNGDTTFVLTNAGDFIVLLSVRTAA